MIWRADPPEGRRTIALDGLTLIFHRRSGMTHVVASPVPEILDALAQGPADVAEIAARLAGRFEIGDAGGDAGGAEAAIAARLAELAESGLVVGQ